jgi:asparagine synthase (glutamine-hydrolysing)
MQVSRYWKPPLDGRVRYRKTEDYIEHYKDLLRQATNDRLRSDRVSIFMSGGLDSTTVAAAATQLASGAGKQISLKAFATVFDKQMADRERHYSGLAAEALGIPIEHLPADGLKLFQDLDGPEAMTPEPYHDPLLAVSIRRRRHASSHSRVALTGEGGDVVFRYSPPSILSWAFGRLLLNSWRYAARYRRVPRLGLRTGFKKLWHGERTQDMDGYPGWLNQDLERRLNLRDRWEFVCGERPRLHPFRPDSYSLLGLSSWRIIFETYDPGWTRFPIEFRHPLFDTRLVTYLLSLPNEIFFDKLITREAMKGLLPEPVRARPKTPLAADPMRGQADRFQEIMREFIADPRLAKYVNVSAIPRRAKPADDFNGLWLNLRPVSFNLWLRRSACEA